MGEEDRDRARPARWLTISALVVAASWWAAAPTGAVTITCADISAYQHAVESGSAGESPRPVGVVVHIMERPGHACEVRSRWTPNQVSVVFGASPGDQRAANAVWSPANVRFALQEVALHQFTPADGMVDSQNRIKVPMNGPTGDNAFEDAFRALVSQFHRDRKVNVYLWPRIGGGPVGFGRSTRSGDGKASVWLDTRCSRQSLLGCGTLVAHELGHALGLYHAGPGTCGSVASEFQGLCAVLSAPCAGVAKRSRLMALGVTGRKLCPAESAAAVEMADSDFR